MPGISLWPKHEDPPIPSSSSPSSWALDLYGARWGLLLWKPCVATNGWRCSVCVPGFKHRVLGGVDDLPHALHVHVMRHSAGAHVLGLRIIKRPRKQGAKAKNWCTGSQTAQSKEEPYWICPEVC